MSKAAEIWVLVEMRSGTPTDTSLQLVDGARRLAAEKGLETAAILLGGSAAEADVLCARAPLVLHLENAGLQPYEAGRAMSALAKLLAARGLPAAILAPASAMGLELMPRLAARLRAGYLGSCSAAWWEGDRLAIRRAVLGGRAYREMVFTGRPAVCTLRAGALPKAEPFSGPGKKVALPLDLPAQLGAEIVSCERTGSGRKDVSEAARVVAGGRGVADRGCFPQVEELAALLGGAVGCSRAVVDAGIRPLDEQVGKSGKTISPDLYIACGISGAVHHVLGMNSSRVVVAINSDPGAAIFKSADFGLVGDVAQVLPALIAAVRSAGSG